MRLSVQSANKFYKTYVYCDLESSKLFRLNKIPFHKIVVVDWLDNVDFPNWSLSKLETMVHQTSPYIHIDLDTIITKKFKPRKEGISWGYGEINLKLNNRFKYESIEHLNNYYDIAKKYEDYKSFDYSIIPNASVVIVNKVFPIRDIILKLKDRIKPYKDIIDSKINMFMEQFLLYQMIISKEHITHSIISNTNYNDITDYWLTEIKNNNKELENFIDNGFVHWPMFDTINQNDYNFIYEYFLNHLDLEDLRNLKKVKNVLI